MNKWYGYVVETKYGFIDICESQCYADVYSSHLKDIFDVNYKRVGDIYERESPLGYYED